MTTLGTEGDDHLQGTVDNDTLQGGSGNDTIEGSGGADWIEGGDEAGSWGGDWLYGGPGADTLLGGAGDDWLDGETGADSLDGGEGDDTLWLNTGEGSDTLAGGAGNDSFSVWLHDTGSAQQVVVDGGEGDDLIQVVIANWGGGDDGVTATGGAGVDTYVFGMGENAWNLAITDFATGVGGDRIDVSALLEFSASGGRGYEGGNPMASGQGYLRLVQSGSDTLLQYDEDGAAGTAYGWHTAITLQNVAVHAVDAHNFKPLTIVGTAGDDSLSGGLGVDTLVGGAGDDLLDGGWGNDSMQGGAGNDAYQVDHLGDVVREVAGEGSDRVVAAIDYVLAGNVEQLALGSGASRGTGNALANVITGNGAANLLDGGAGRDTLSGGQGNDVYRVDVVTDKVVEASTGGTDTVLSTASGYTLAANVENGRIVASGAASLTGNALANLISGNASANVLDGGTGRDTLSGGQGNDQYRVDQATDAVVEVASGGIDTVLSTAAGYTLAANMENGRIVAAGSASLTGNEMANVLTAGAGNNLLDGRGGVDAVSYAFAGAGVSLNLARTWAQATGGSGSDTLRGIENVIGSAYADRLTGSAGGNRLEGRGGNDVLAGGEGRDVLLGGVGTDIFEFNAVGDSRASASARDVIADFTFGDKIDLVSIDARAATAANEAFTFIGSRAFSANATGQLRAVYDSARDATILYGSTDADATAEFAVELTGVQGLTAAGIVL